MNAPSAPGRFAQLGTGGRDDRLRFALVLHILWRTLPLLRAVRGHLVALTATLVVFLLIGIPVTLIMTDVLFTRVLEGQPLTPIEARSLALDPDLYTQAGDDGELMAPAERRAVRDRWLLILLLLSLPTLPIGGGLVYYAIWILQRINQVLRVSLLTRIQTLSLRFHVHRPCLQVERCCRLVCPCRRLIR